MRDGMRYTDELLLMESPLASVLIRMAFCCYAAYHTIPEPTCLSKTPHLQTASLAPP